MIVHKTNKSYVTMSSKPNDNFGGEDYYVVEDYTNLYYKILNAPHKFDLVVEDDELVDVIYIEKTQEEVNEERVEEIKQELVKLDNTVDRQWEDYYIRENITPVDRIKVVIEQKEELRTELQTLTNVVAENNN